MIEVTFLQSQYWCPGAYVLIFRLVIGLLPLAMCAVCCPVLICRMQLLALLVYTRLH